MDSAVLTRALRFFHPYFAEQCFIDFYGGEPLLAFDEIRRAVLLMEALSKKRARQVRYALSTNGSLLNDDILDFLERHSFSVLLSFDGYAQDISRKKGSFDFLVSVIPKILTRPRISLETNSVFTSETIGYLSTSIQLITELGVPKIDVTFSRKTPWTESSLLRLKKEMALVRSYFRSRHQKKEDVPWADLLEELAKGVYRCPAGLKKMALATDGTLWGCFLFPQYFNGFPNIRDSQKYCFGEVDTFIKDHRQIYPQKLANYSALRMDGFLTPDGPCALCDEIQECFICPVAAALTSREIGRISASTCHGAKMWREEKKLFLEEFKEPNQ